MRKAEQFTVKELGTSYLLPKFRVVDGKGIESLVDREKDKLQGTTPDSNSFQEITFVRGDKTDNGEVIPRVNGILIEQLLGVMIKDLKYKNSLIPSRESSLAITKLEEALFWLEERQRDRESRNVVGTYNK